MKKTVALLLCLMCCFAAQAEKRAVKIVTTVFPIYDWTREIAGDDVEIEMLLDTGVDLHSFKPTAQDILNIGTCDCFIYVGGESDQWVEDALSSAMNPQLKAINLLDVLGGRVKQEELVEGMEGEEEEEGEEGEADEHVWLSLRNAEFLTAAIAEALGEIDPDNQAAYAQRAEQYCEELNALDARYADAVDQARFDTLLFGDRFPFRYLVDDYGLNYYAAFSGCSAETEASFSTVLFLAQKVDELGLKTVVKVESSDGRIAETIVNSTQQKDQNIVTLNAMQTITAQDVQEGASYLDIMTRNLDALKEALN